MTFGKHSASTVWEIINVLGDIDYLHWVYYNMSNISYHEDILQEIGIVNRIEKPSKNPELYIHIHKSKYIEGLSIPKACHFKKMAKDTKKRKVMQSNYFHANSKSDLAYNNRHKL